jgi:hypothetical protein
MMIQIKINKFKIIKIRKIIKYQINWIIINKIKKLIRLKTENQNQFIHQLRIIKMKKISK